MAHITHFVVVLYNIRSAHNVGSIFRTSDALSIEKLYLCGITPKPGQIGPSASLRAGKDLAKTALGAEKTVMWEYIKRTTDCIKHLKKQGFCIVVLEQDKKSIDIRRFRVPLQKKIALILGAEINGVSRPLLKQCDAIVEIPMWGKKESLNVSVAFGIAGYLLKLK